MQVSFCKRASNYWALSLKITCVDTASYGSSPPCSSCLQYSNACVCVCERENKIESTHARGCVGACALACVRARVRACTHPHTHPQPPSCTHYTCTYIISVCACCDPPLTPTHTHLALAHFIIDHTRVAAVAHHDTRNSISTNVIVFNES